MKTWNQASKEAQAEPKESKAEEKKYVKQIKYGWAKDSLQTCLAQLLFAIRWFKSTIWAVILRLLPLSWLDV
jgi:hypothetical protein